jgi:hypothetical protein
MSRLTRARALTLAGAAALCALVAGCGKTGELERPAPIFGRARTNAPPATGENDASRPVRTIDPRDVLDNPGPSRTDEIPGQAPNPIAPGPQGVLPDPYTYPR